MAEKVKYAVAITTVDNPFDPLDDFDHWIAFDMEKGYNTSAYLDRVCFTSDGLTDSENTKEIERAIDEIISIDPFGLYKKVKKEL